MHDLLELKDNIGLYVLQLHRHVAGVYWHSLRETVSHADYASQG